MCITCQRQDLIHSIIPEIARPYHCEVTEIACDRDHVHFLLRYPPTAVLSAVAGALESKSASAILDAFGPVYWGKHERTFWSSGFFLCSVGGATIEILRQYIENQGR